MRHEAILHNQLGAKARKRVAIESPRRAPRSRKTSASEHVSPLATMNLVLRTDRYSNPFAKILSTTIPTVPNIKVLPALSSRTSPVATSRLPDLTAMS